MNIPTSMSEIVSSLSDAVVASGKKLVDIGKEPIHQYLEKVGAPKQYWNDIYEKLRDLHEPGRHGTSGSAATSYAPAALLQEKHREPRKSVFGPVKKIAG
jgi:hypothetical protein